MNCPLLLGNMAARKKQYKISPKQREIAIKMHASVIYFIKGMWGLYPQPVKPEHASTVKLLITERNYESLRAEYFDKFILGKHITWQQYQILLSIEDASNHRDRKKITIRAGRGVGKSCALAWCVIWYMYTRPHCNVACTAPNQTQMYDVLWKYIAEWVGKLPPGHKEKFDVQGSYVRITESPNTWFARAKTARKENPEALSGLHSKFGILLIIDEASGVDDKIIKTGEESLTEDEYVMIMISNPTRLIGHFYQTHKNAALKKFYRVFQLNAEESPVVKKESIQEIIDKYGKDSDEYRVNVLGDFPREDHVDKEGYVPLLSRDDIRQVPCPYEPFFTGRAFLGIDPAGEGRDKTVWVMRDAFKARVVLEEAVSTPRQIAARTVGLLELYHRNLQADDVFVDMFGIGAETVKELYLFGKYVNGVMVGDQCDDKEDKERFINKKACLYFRFRKWLKSGGELERHSAWEEEGISIRYRRSSGSQRLQIMSKKDMKNRGLHSPDHIEALMLTFADDDLSSSAVETVTPGSYHNNSYETVVYGNSNRQGAI
jgi:hypothetical protein